MGAAGLGLTLVEVRLRTGWLQRWRRLAPLPLTLLLAVIALGALRMSWEQRPPGTHDLVTYHSAGVVEVVGTITSDPEQRDRDMRARVHVETLKVKADASGLVRQVRGAMLVNLPIGTDWRYGERVNLVGNLETPSETPDFSYRSYLLHQGIRSVMSFPRVQLLEGRGGNFILASAYAIRRKAYQTANLLWPQPEGALLSGILLGLDGDLPMDLQRAYQVTGTAHIIAISGFNISILAGLLLMLFRRGFSKYTAAGLTLASLVFYSALVGAQPPVLRAALMGALALGGQLIGRRQTGLNSLGFAAAFFTLFNPYLLWDASFQLSFMATLGLVLFAGEMQEKFEGWLGRRLSARTARRVAEPVAEYFLVTFAAQLTTLPILAWHFRRISLSALLANPLVLPVQPALMVLGGLALLAGMVWLPLGRLLALLTFPLAAYTDRMVTLLARLPGGSLAVGDFSGWLVALFYAVLLMLALGVARLPSLMRWLRPGLTLGVMGLAATMVWAGVLHGPDARLHLILLPGQDEAAVFLQAPGGETLLINGGADSSTVGSLLGLRISPLDRRVDGLLLSARRSASVQALPRLLERFPIQQAFWDASLPSSSAVQRVQTQILSSAGEGHMLHSGDVIKLGGQVNLRLLVESESGAAWQVEYGNLAVTIPGGVAPDVLPEELCSGTGVLILSAAEIPAWSACTRPMVLTNAEPGERPGEYSTLGTGWLEMVSNGSRVWLQSGY